MDPLAQLSPEAELLMKVLLHRGYDSRVGALCCAPVRLSSLGDDSGSLCLVVSLKLAALMARAFWKASLNTAAARRDADVVALEYSWRSAFTDVSKLKVCLAEKHLPLWPGDKSRGTRDDVLVLDAALVTCLWERWLARLAPQAPLLSDYAKQLRQIVTRQSSRPRAPGAPRTYLECPSAYCAPGHAPPIAIGRALAWEQVDHEALGAFVRLVRPAEELRPREHVGPGWRGVRARIRSAAEVAYDEEQHYPVGDVEVLSMRAVPLPALDFSRPMTAFSIALTTKAPWAVRAISDAVWGSGRGSRPVLGATAEALEELWREHASLGEGVATP